MAASGLPGFRDLPGLIGEHAWQGGRMVTVRRNREVVLCASAIQSPQLLELSEGGPGCAAAALGGAGAA